MAKSKLSFDKDFLVQLRCTLRTESEEQAEFISDCFLLLLYVLEDSLDGLPEPVVRSSLGRFESFLLKPDWKTTMDVLKECDTNLTNWFAVLKQSQTFNLSALSREIQGSVVSPIIKMDINYMEKYRRLHQVFSFLKKVTLPGSTELIKSAEDQFKDLNRNTQRPNRSECKREAKVIERWLADWERPELNKLQHGPGKVANPATVSLEQKYESIFTDHLIRSTWNDEYFPSVNRIKRTSRFTTVPKSYNKRRSIACEPAVLMIYQQALKDSLYSLFSHDPYLSRRFVDRDQTRNRVRARYGSIDGSYATIDLSHASDSVSFGIVRQFFANTKLLPYLLSCRSTSTTISGEEVYLRIYATMGSAVTFPLEVLVFSAIVETAISMTGHNPTYSKYLVYGDDIIVETKYAEAVIQRLELYGFRVNKEKSYFTPDSRYRESCGAEWLNGYDVAPIMLSRKFSGLGDRCRSVSEFTDLANRCFYLLPSVRKCLLRHTNLIVPYTEPHSEIGLWSVHPTNYNSHVVFPRDRIYYEKPRVLKGHGDISEIISDCAQWSLYEWLRLAELCPDREEAIVVSSGRVQSRIGRCRISF